MKVPYQNYYRILKLGFLKLFFLSNIKHILFSTGNTMYTKSYVTNPTFVKITAY